MFITLHLQYITLHYITLYYITLYYITLHYITLHYITLHLKHSAERSRRASAELLVVHDLPHCDDDDGGSGDGGGDRLGGGAAASWRDCVPPAVRACAASRPRDRAATTVTYVPRRRRPFFSHAARTHIRTHGRDIRVVPRPNPRARFVASRPGSSRSVRHGAGRARIRRRYHESEPAAVIGVCHTPERLSRGRAGAVSQRPRPPVRPPVRPRLS